MKINLKSSFLNVANLKFFLESCNKFLLARKASMMLYGIHDTATENDDYYEYHVDDNDDDGHLLDAPSKSCRQHHLED